MPAESVPASVRRPRDQWWEEEQWSWAAIVKAGAENALASCKGCGLRAREYIERMQTKGVWGFLSRHCSAFEISSECAICRAWPAQRVCADCTARLTQPVHRCSRCAIALPSGNPVCGACLQHPPALDECLAAVDYAYPWNHLLSDFKFHQDPAWAKALATLMRSMPWVEPAMESADWLIPVPLARSRLLERGFNQSLELARALAPGKVLPQALLRIRATETQSRLQRAERLRNLRGAFAVHPHFAASLRQQRVLLVDDVMTTGATLESAALALRECGVAHIGAIVFARTS